MKFNSVAFSLLLASTLAACGGSSTAPTPASKPLPTPQKQPAQPSPSVPTANAQDAIQNPQPTNSNQQPDPVNTSQANQSTQTNQNPQTNQTNQVNEPNQPSEPGEPKPAAKPEPEKAQVPDFDPETTPTVSSSLGLDLRVNPDTVNLASATSLRQLGKAPAVQSVAGVPLSAAAKAELEAQLPIFHPAAPKQTFYTSHNGVNVIEQARSANLLSEHYSEEDALETFMFVHVPNRPAYQQEKAWIESQAGKAKEIFDVFLAEQAAEIDAVRGSFAQQASDPLAAGAKYDHLRAGIAQNREVIIQADAARAGISAGYGANEVLRTAPGSALGSIFINRELLGLNALTMGQTLVSQKLPSGQYQASLKQLQTAVSNARRGSSSAASVSSFSSSSLGSSSGSSSSSRSLDAGSQTAQGTASNEVVKQAVNLASKATGFSTSSLAVQYPCNASNDHIFCQASTYLGSYFADYGQKRYTASDLLESGKLAPSALNSYYLGVGPDYRPAIGALTGTGVKVLVMDTNLGNDTVDSRTQLAGFKSSLLFTDRAKSRLTWYGKSQGTPSSQAAPQVHGMRVANIIAGKKEMLGLAPGVSLSLADWSGFTGLVSDAPWYNRSISDSARLDGKVRESYLYEFFKQMRVEKPHVVNHSYGNLYEFSPEQRTFLLDRLYDLEALNADMRPFAAGQDGVDSNRKSVFAQYHSPQLYATLQRIAGFWESAAMGKDAPLHVYAAGNYVQPVTAQPELKHTWSYKFLNTFDGATVTSIPKQFQDFSLFVTGYMRTGALREDLYLERQWESIKQLNVLDGLLASRKNVLSIIEQAKRTVADSSISEAIRNEAQRKLNLYTQERIDKLNRAIRFVSYQLLKTYQTIATAYGETATSSQHSYDQSTLANPDVSAEAFSAAAASWTAPEHLADADFNVDIISQEYQQIIFDGRSAAIDEGNFAGVLAALDLARFEPDRPEFKHSYAQEKMQRLQQALTQIAALASGQTVEQAFAAQLNADTASQAYLDQQTQKVTSSQQAQAQEFATSWIDTRLQQVSAFRGESLNRQDAALGTSIVPNPGAYQCGALAYHCLASSFTYVVGKLKNVEHVPTADDAVTVLPDEELVGTSFAAPTVSATAALVKQQFPFMTANQLKQTLLTTATDVGKPGVDENFGWGVLNGAKAVQGPGMLAFGKLDLDLNRGLSGDVVGLEHADLAQAKPKGFGFVGFVELLTGKETPANYAEGTSEQTPDWTSEETKRRWQINYAQAKTLLKLDKTTFDPASHNQKVFGEFARSSNSETNKFTGLDGAADATASSAATPTSLSQFLTTSDFNKKRAEAALTTQDDSIRNRAYFFTNNIAGTGSLWLNGNNTSYLYLLGHNSYTGATVVETGNLAYTSRQRWFGDYAADILAQTQEIAALTDARSARRYFSQGLGNEPLTSKIDAYYAVKSYLPSLGFTEYANSSLLAAKQLAADAQSSANDLNQASLSHVSDLAQAKAQLVKAYGEYAAMRLPYHYQLHQHAASAARSAFYVKDQANLYLTDTSVGSLASAGKVTAENVFVANNLTLDPRSQLTVLLSEHNVVTDQQVTTDAQAAQTLAQARQAYAKLTSAEADKLSAAEHNDLVAKVEAAKTLQGTADTKLQTQVDDLLAKLKLGTDLTATTQTLTAESTQLADLSDYDKSRLALAFTAGYECVMGSCGLDLNNLTAAQKQQLAAKLSTSKSLLDYQDAQIKHRLGLLAQNAALTVGGHGHLAGRLVISGAAGHELLAGKTYKLLQLSSLSLQSQTNPENSPGVDSEHADTNAALGSQLTNMLRVSTPALTAQAQVLDFADGKQVRVSLQPASARSLSTSLVAASGLAAEDLAIGSELVHQVLDTTSQLLTAASNNAGATTPTTTPANTAGNQDEGKVLTAALATYGKQHELYALAADSLLAQDATALAQVAYRASGSAYSSFITWLNQTNSLDLAGPTSAHGYLEPFKMDVANPTRHQVYADYQVLTNNASQVVNGKVTGHKFNLGYAGQVPGLFQGWNYGVGLEQMVGSYSELVTPISASSANTRAAANSTSTSANLADFSFSQTGLHASLGLAGLDYYAGLTLAYRYSSVEAQRSVLSEHDLSSKFNHHQAQANLSAAYVLAGSARHGVAVVGGLSGLWSYVGQLNEQAPGVSAGFALTTKSGGVARANLNASGAASAADSAAHAQFSAQAQLGLQGRYLAADNLELSGTLLVHQGLNSEVSFKLASQAGTKFTTSSNLPETWVSAQVQASYQLGNWTLSAEAKVAKAQQAYRAAGKLSARYSF